MIPDVTVGGLYCLGIVAKISTTIKGRIYRFRVG